MFFGFFSETWEFRLSWLWLACGVMIAFFLRMFTFFVWSGDLLLVFWIYVNFELLEVFALRIRDQSWLSSLNIASSTFFLALSLLRMFMRPLFISLKLLFNRLHHLLFHLSIRQYSQSFRPIIIHALHPLRRQFPFESQRQRFVSVSSRLNWWSLGRVLIL